MTSLNSILWRTGLSLLFSVLSIQAKDRFLLESELFTNFASGSQVKVFTGYSYNDSGNRVEKHTYNGPDSNAAAMSRTVYVYTQDNTLSDEVLKTAAGDTVSIVRYSYDAGKRRIAVSTLTKLQALRYVDSMAYDADGQMTAKRRYSGGALSFYNTYSYNAAGKKLSDTLHETNGTDFSASQAVIFSYDGNGRVQNEKNSRFQAGSWYLISTNKMAYTSSGSLGSVTQYEGDGASNLMQDSLAYAYDNSGNRTRESHYDNNRALISTTDYTWIDTQPTFVFTSKKVSEKSGFKFENGKLLMTGTEIHGTIRLSLFDTRGKLVRQSQHQGSACREFSLAPEVGRGSYIAVLRGENLISTCHFTTVN
jgi:antitoxin component YwqK of YwqJK toxin-antitoxin module